MFAGLTLLRGGRAARGGEHVQARRSRARWPSCARRRRTRRSRAVAGGHVQRPALARAVAELRGAAIMSGGSTLPRAVAELRRATNMSGGPTLPCAVAELRERASVSGGRRFRVGNATRRTCSSLWREADGGVGPLSSASRRQPVFRRATGKCTPEANAPGGGGHWGACGNRSACRSCTAWWCKRRWGETDWIVFSCSERLATGQFHLASVRGHLPVFCPVRVSGCLPRAFRWSSPPRPFITSSVLLGLCIPASVGPPGMCRRVGPRSSRRPARPHGSVGPPDMFAASRSSAIARSVGPRAAHRVSVGPPDMFAASRSSVTTWGRRVAGHFAAQLGHRSRERRAAGHVRRLARLSHHAGVGPQDIFRHRARERRTAGHVGLRGSALREGLFSDRYQRLPSAWPPPGSVSPPDMFAGPRSSGTARASGRRTCSPAAARLAARHFAIARGSVGPRNMFVGRGASALREGLFSDRCQRSPSAWPPRGSVSPRTFRRPRAAQPPRAGRRVAEHVRRPRHRVGASGSRTCSSARPSRARASGPRGSARPPARPPPRKRAGHVRRLAQLGHRAGASSRQTCSPRRSATAGGSVAPPCGSVGQPDMVAAARTRGSVGLAQLGHRARERRAPSQLDHCRERAASAGRTGPRGVARAVLQGARGVGICPEGHIASARRRTRI